MTSHTRTCAAHVETQVVAAGRPERRDGAPVNPPVTLSSTFVSPGAPEGFVYTRLGSPTWLPLEEALAGLEGGPAGSLVFGSGMAAVSAAMSLAEPGAAIVISRHSYHTTLLAAHDLAARSGGRVLEVDIAETGAVMAALDEAEGTGTAGAFGRAAPLLWLESPTNPMLDIADLPALIGHVHDLGGLAVVDNTFATPLAQRPLGLGADVVVHSVTKYLSGHSDVVLGAAVPATGELSQRLRAHRDVHGAIASPSDAWLALRGLRTLALRVERSQANAAALAARLDGHPLVEQVVYPGLASHPQHARAAAQMSGFGSILTLRPRGGEAAAEAVARAVRVWVPATSLGGVESSLERRRRFPTEAPTVPEDQLRLSVGIEHVDDLIADLEQALRRAQATAGGG